MKKLLLIIVLLCFLVGCMPQPSYDNVYNVLSANATWMKNNLGDVWGYMKVSGNVYRWGYVNATTQRTSYSGPILWNDLQMYINYYRAIGFQYTTILQINPSIISVVITTIMRILPSSVWFVLLPSVQFGRPIVPANTIGNSYPAP